MAHSPLDALRLLLYTSLRLLEFNIGLKKPLTKENNSIQLYIADFQPRSVPDASTLRLAFSITIGLVVGYGRIATAALLR